MHFFRIAIFAALLVVAALSSSVSASGRLPLELTQKRLSDTLIELAQLADVSIIFSADTEFDLEQSPPLKGNYSLSEALDLLLQESALEAVFIYDDVIAIRPRACVARRNCEDPALDRSDLANNPRLEQMTVVGKTLTGSRIRRTNFNGSSAVDLISAFDIELAGAQSIGELLRNLPSVVGNSTSTSISNGGDGTASVTLRGLPASSTLVLINGRRVANDGLAGTRFDLNTLTPGDIERIEVLKGGSSAVYGSDAIAGVINIIMKRELDGVELDVYRGIAEENDLETYSGSLRLGKKFQRGDAIMSFSLFDQDPIFSRDRAVSASADLRQFGGSDRRSSATPSTRIRLPDDRTVTLARTNTGDFLPGTDPNDFRAVNADDRYNFQQSTTAIVPSRRESYYFAANYDLTGNATIYADYNYSRNQAKAQFAPTPVFTGFESIALPVDSTQIYNVFGTELNDLRRRIIELPERQQDNQSSAERFGLGLETHFAGLNWNLEGHWSKTEARETIKHLVNAENLARALGPAANCQGIDIDNCEPVNLFGPPGSIDENQLGYIRANSRHAGYFKVSGLSLSTTANLGRVPAGAIEAALGIEYRKESSQTAPVGVAAAVLGGASLGASSGERNIREFYVESVIPLYRNNRQQSVNLELASRFSSYSDFGSTNNPRIALNARANRNLLLRVSYAKGFRAPSLLELNQVNGESQAFLQDPCAEPSNVGVLIGCNQASDPTRQQYLTLEGGNSELEPEHSKHFSAGFVLNPETMERFSASIDYFKLQQRDVIDSNAQFILNQNAQSNAFNDRVERDQNGELLLINATEINVGRRDIEGLDFNLHFATRKSKFGRVHFSANASHILSFEEQADSSLPSQQIRGTFFDAASAGRGAIPKWKANVGAYWKHKQWQANWTSHYVSSLREITNEGSHRQVDHWLSHDIQVSHIFLIKNGFRLTFGVNNLSNETPPILFSAFNDNIDPRTHNLIGRYAYLKLSAAFQ